MVTLLASYPYYDYLFQIDWSKGGVALHNFIRGLDSSPGATSHIAPQTREGIVDGDNVEVKFFGSSLWQGEYEAEGDCIILRGLKQPAVIHDAGLLVTANDGVKVSPFDVFPILQ